MASIKHIKNISDHFLELEKRVSKVRFARIEASKRLKTKGVIYNTIISFYSILITVIAIVFSIVNFNELTDENLITKFSAYQSESVIILGLSTFITMFTLFFSNRTYSERAAKYQSNYMELTRLLADIQNLMVYYKLQNHDEYLQFKALWESRHHKKDLEKRLAKKYKIFADKYAALLTQSENHEDIDYKKACLDEVTDEIVLTEKKYFGNILLKRERTSMMLDSKNDIKIENYKEYLELAPPETQHNPLPMELNKLYRKQSELEHTIFATKVIESLKTLGIMFLPIILAIILDLFKGYLNTIH